MEFHDKVKKLRTSKGFSQEELARRSGLSLRTIQRIENNETTPHGDTMRKIFEVLESAPNIELADKAQKIIPSNKVSAFFENWKIPLFLYFLSLIIFISSLVIREGITGKISFVFSHICIFSLLVSTIYQFQKRNWKTGIKVGLLTVMTLIISTSIVLSFIPYKAISISNTNGRVVKVETNLMTGKSDTTVTYEKHFRKR